jgi:hypothetical protein
VAIVVAAAWLGAGMTARLALAGDQADWRMPGHPARPPARHAYLIMNPKSGGGKAGKLDLVRKAEDLGAEVFLIGGPEPADVAKVARQAVDRAPTCSASRAATARRRWRPASPNPGVCKRRLPMAPGGPQSTKAPSAPGLATACALLPRPGLRTANTQMAAVTVGEGRRMPRPGWIAPDDVIYG